ncbi:LysR family transcriptional regulator [Vibrio parahaemolyticus]|jgi:DNA-binding transcriptional LysR family regulator|uniref:LysR family transcriptional regulator n=10 Tax=Vibrionaceae TaxID=641 RepID=A0A072HEU8_VIBPH|nr:MULTISPECIES: LysR family transcriptional regulator [Vibrio]EFO49736.1 transcriptional regulator, LysR family [Vibrio parahaemolyticus K5030]EJG0763720.1 LysR family transcriptional regulator [Vibrio parahaemolyticus O5:K30]EJG0873430.1 LysR family transcriptional regulator [Vibrio parahaemolyticus O3]EJG0902088.1 LysR family transcriptional regulator [Vibrio parahaemolyticus O3:K56]EJG0920885.1 LysR family transcriptional regulator [Vibrio parahaemolyticus O1:K68]EJG0930776.1 LysR family 
MDVKVFRTFLELAKVRHFGRAAENLYITQAAVSARIKQLESYFDTQLFIRDRNNIKLTSAGERLISYAEVMVTTLQQAKLELSLEDGKALQLTMGGTPNIWDAYLQNCLSIVTDSFGGYGFMAEVMGREMLSRSLLERTLDMAFAFDQIKADELNCKKVADVVLVLVSTEQDSLDTVFEHKYVYVDWGTRFASEHSERHPKIPAPYLRTSTARIALDFILEKGGAAYLPVSLVEPFIANGQLYKVSGVEDWYRPIYLSYRKASTSVEAIKQVEEIVKEIDPLTAYSLQQIGSASSDANH